jgi:capsular polysaccharide transport system ATP-binding protein
MPPHNATTKEIAKWKSDNPAIAPERPARSPAGAGEPGKIAAIDIVQEYDTPAGRRRVLDGISFEIGPAERIAIFGQNGAGKSTLIRLLSGLQKPTSGRIERGLTMSWPLAFDGGFSGEMTGYDNIRFIAQIYGKPFRDLFDYVDDFSELGKHMFVPMRDYSSGMRMRLAFALTLGINFDCILIDEVIAVGDRRFQLKCHRELFEKRADCAMIIASHAEDIAREYCSAALVLKNGRGKVFRDLDLAMAIYRTL